jgi:hypothetical protein
MGDTWHMLTSATYVARGDVAKDVEIFDWVSSDESGGDTWHDYYAMKRCHVAQ